MTNAPSNPYFAEVAEQWDEIRSGYFTEHMRDAAIAKAHLPPQAIVADVGTGTGFVAAGLAAQAKHVIGFDASPDMLAVARRNLAQLQQRGIPRSDGRSTSRIERDVRWGVRQHVSAPRARSAGDDQRNGADPQDRTACCASPISIRTITNGSANKWLICGWALSAMTFGAGSRKRDCTTSMWIARKGRAMPAGRTAK